LHMMICFFFHRSCPSAFQRGKTESTISLNAVHSSQGHDTTGHTSKRVLGQPASQERSQSLRSEDSSLHYADIQVCSRTQPRSTREVKHLQLENATEYATLRFPQATPRYDSKNGTLV
uniref:Chromosome 11 open reading frame 52 n=1 Tax=Equus asinus asinus TaxID=83772 RepID=A0A8C4LKR6_EQUAS